MQGNLLEIGTVLPGGWGAAAAHHDLPLEFEEFFLLRGLDPNNLNYGRWIEQTKHEKIWHNALEPNVLPFTGGAYNNDWRIWINGHPDATKSAILEQLSAMRNTYQ